MKSDGPTCKMTTDITEAKQNGRDAKVDAKLYCKELDFLQTHAEDRLLSASSHGKSELYRRTKDAKLLKDCTIKSASDVDCPEGYDVDESEIKTFKMDCDTKM